MLGGWQNKPDDYQACCMVHVCDRYCVKSRCCMVHIYQLKGLVFDWQWCFNAGNSVSIGNVKIEFIFK